MTLHKDGWIMRKRALTLPDSAEFMMLGSISVLSLPLHIMACGISLGALMRKS